MNKILFAANMDQSTRNSVQKVTGVMVLVLGIFMSIIGVSLALAAPIFGVPLTIGALLMVYAGVYQLREAMVQEKRDLYSKKELLGKEYVDDTKVEDELVPGSLMANDNQPKSSTEKPAMYNYEPLNFKMEWVYTADEWERFIASEKRYRRLQKYILMVLVGILGAYTLKDKRGVPFEYAVIPCMALGYFIGWLSEHIMIGILRSKKSREHKIILTYDKLMINTKLILLRDSYRRLIFAKMIIQDSIPMIELRVGWRTRHGDTFEDIHIPVPEGKISEAEKAVLMLNR